MHRVSGLKSHQYRRTEWSSPHFTNVKNWDQCTFYSHQKKSLPTPTSSFALGQSDCFSRGAVISNHSHDPGRCSLSYGVEFDPRTEEYPFWFSALSQKYSYQKGTYLYHFHLLAGCPSSHKFGQCLLPDNNYTHGNQW